MTIRSGALRAGIFISTIIIGAILAIQLFWLVKMYRYEEKNFDHSVMGAFKEWYSSSGLLKDNSPSLNNLVKKENPQTYTAALEGNPDAQALGMSMADALDDFEIYAHSRIRVINSRTNQTLYEKEIHGAEEENPSPKIARSPGLYLQLFFPTRERYILSNMQLWIVSSVILLGVLIWLGASIFYLYRQKNLNELQKDLVNNFTHEFKTPLSVITLALESLKKKSPQSDKVNQYADMIGSQTSYLQQQIDRLLRHSHLEGSKPTIRPEPVEMAALVSQAVQQLQPLIDHKKAEVEMVNNSSNTVLEADANYILIVLINLIDNALKYSSQPRVRILLQDVEHGLTVEVKDNGEGIDEKHFKDIFRKFYRVPKGDIHSAKGFGIGLSFVKKIMDAHKGWVKVSSIKGEGSSFTFFLNKDKR